MTVPARGSSPELSPGLERARELAAEANVIPLVHTWVEDAETPVSAFLKLRGEGPCYLLESAEQGGRMGRYSFIGVRPHAVLRWGEGEMQEWRGEAAYDVAGSEPSERWAAPDPYGAVAERVGRFRLAEVEGLPPFPGGAVGLFAFDLVRTVEPLGEPNPDPLGLPDLALMVAEAMVVFDHHDRTASIIANAFVGEGETVDDAYERAARTAGELRERLRKPAPAREPGDGVHGAARRSRRKPTRMGCPSAFAAT